MKKIICILTGCTLLLNLHAQQQNQGAATKISSDTSAATIKKNSEEVAYRIANKMRDSLSLNASETKKVYEINLWLQAKKMEARKEYAGSPVIAQKLQQIENLRDSLYKKVIADSVKYNYYRRKKGHVINNN